MGGQFSSLPPNPLSRGEVEALNEHDAFQFCRAVSRVEAQPDSIVELAIGIDGTASILLFNPAEQQWEQVHKTDIPEGPAENPFDREEIDEHVNKYYDEDELEPVSDLAELIPLIVAGFPDEPLERQELIALGEQHPKIANLLSVAEAAASSKSLGVLFFVDDPVEEIRITAVAGFDPDAGTWQLVDSTKSSEPELRQALSQLQETFLTWMDARYSPQEYAPVSNPTQLLDE